MFIENKPNASSQLTTKKKRLVTCADQSPWLSKIKAYNYLDVSPKTFQKLIDKGVIKPHSLFEFGVARELFNKSELDEAIKRL